MDYRHRNTMLGSQSSLISPGKPADLMVERPDNDRVRTVARLTNLASDDPQRVSRGVESPRGERAERDEWQ